MKQEEKIYYQLIEIALITKYNAGHWFRYLRKYITDKDNIISKDVFIRLYNSKKLTAFQKVSLKFAMEEGSETNEYIRSLNRKSELPHIKKLKEKYKFD